MEIWPSVWTEVVQISKFSLDNQVNCPSALYALGLNSRSLGNDRSCGHKATHELCALTFFCSFSFIHGNHRVLWLTPCATFSLLVQ